MKRKDKKNKGFTLVELIVVIMVLAILSAGAVAAYGNITEAAEKAAVNADAQALCRVLNTYNALAPAADAIDTADEVTTSMDFSKANAVLDGMALSVSLDADRLALIKLNINYGAGGWTVNPTIILKAAGGGA